MGRCISIAAICQMMTSPSVARKSGVSSRLPLPRGGAGGEAVSRRISFHNSRRDRDMPRTSMIGFSRVWIFKDARPRFGRVKQENPFPQRRGFFDGVCDDDQVRFCSLHRESVRFCRSSRVTASRDEKGSSINNRSGREASVRAMAVRCRCPPDICAGIYLRLRSDRDGQANRGLFLGFKIHRSVLAIWSVKTAHAQSQFRVLGDRHPWQQPVILQDEPRAWARTGEFFAVDFDLPRSGTSNLPADRAVWSSRSRTSQGSPTYPPVIPAS